MTSWIRPCVRRTSSRSGGVPIVREVLERGKQDGKTSAAAIRNNPKNCLLRGTGKTGNRVHVVVPAGGSCVGKFGRNGSTRTDLHISRTGFRRVLYLPARAKRG